MLRSCGFLNVLRCTEPSTIVPLTYFFFLFLVRRDRRLHHIICRSLPSATATRIQPRDLHRGHVYRLLSDRSYDGDQCE